MAKPPSTDNQTSVVRKDLLLKIAFAFIALVLLSPVLSLGLNPDTMTSTGGEGSTLRQVCYIVVAALLLYALKPTENYRRLLAIPLPLLIGVLYCWLSVTWAIEPSVALRRIALMTLIIWMVFAMMRQLKFEEVLFILRWALSLVLLASYAAVIFMPTFGMHSGNMMDNLALAGDWRGILEQKNLAGAACAVMIIVFAFERGRMPKWIQFTAIAAASYFLYRSNSKTSVALCLSGLIAGFIFLRYKLKYKGAVIGVLAVAAVVVSVLNAIYQNPLAGKLADPKAFTGRTKIWNTLFAYIHDHPILGSGYGSFWNIGPNSPVYKYGTLEVTLMPYGHNGFLDMAAQLGLPGLIVIVVVTIFMPFGKLISSPLLIGQKGALLVGLFLFCIGYNFTETALFYPDSFVFIILLITIGLSQPSLINYKREKFSVHNLLRITPTRSADAAGEATVRTRTSIPTASPSVRRRRKQ
ncbi:MAG TPA: O-antigen ligase family protein [Sphingobium sp.]|uniref:O-antigen ligase family protein n=1 Tax=Sphingobium sp. TaxID=1912891 RepID=UPI002ED33F84